jgi:hypothetical protein
VTWRASGRLRHRLTVQLGGRPQANSHRPSSIGHRRGRRARIPRSRGATRVNLKQHSRAQGNLGRVPRAWSMLNTPIASDMAHTPGFSPCPWPPKRGPCSRVAWARDPR